MNDRSRELGSRKATEAASPGAASDPLRVRVELGPRSYDILIGEGILEKAGALIAGRCRAKAGAIVADENTGPLRGAGRGLSRRLRRADIHCQYRAWRALQILSGL